MSSKIPLFKAKSLGFERDFVSFSVKYNNFPRLLCSALVDTGCPYVILIDKTLQKTRIPYKFKPSEEKPVLLGPVKLELKKLGECELFFRNSENNIISPPFKQEVFVGIPLLSKNQILGNELPNFIGKSFFDNHFLSIIKEKDGSSNISISD